MAKKPGDWQGRGFRAGYGGVPGGICPGCKRKTPGQEWNFPFRGHIRSSTSAGRIIPRIRRPRIACFTASVISKRVTGFEFYPTFASGHCRPTLVLRAYCNANVSLQAFRSGRTILIRPLRSSWFTLLSTFPLVISFSWLSVPQ